MIPMYIGDSVEASYIPDKNPELDWGTAPVPQVSEIPPPTCPPAMSLSP